MQRSGKKAKAAKGRPSSRHPVVRVGLLGLGTVGAGVAEILSSHGALIAERTGVRLEVARALVKRRRKRSGASAAVPLTTRASDIIGADDIDVVAELIGGKEMARKFILGALRAGQPVVTANKAVIAAHGAEIFETAAAHRSDVYFEAAVAGGVPIIRTLREGLVSDRIEDLAGILNGTTNFILDQLGQGHSYDAALAQAQKLGFAEADPSLDVGGNDAADKLSILAYLAFGASVDPAAIPTTGVTALTPAVLEDAERLGYRVKLLGIARREGKRGLDMRVHPTFVPEHHALANVAGPDNAIAVRSASLGNTLLKGAGAGGLPTGSAVVADLIEVARNLRGGISGRVSLAGPRSAPKLIDPRKAVCAWYVRLVVAERPGVLAAVTRIFATHKVSLATVIQRDRATVEHPVAVTIVTHPAPTGAMEKALSAIRKLDALKGEVSTVRIEDEPCREQNAKSS